ncbi:hypothetical protein N7472_004709 [Penicillium cf. griseofulvum]|nr:hypothetical protein N7472_004709 [Penicillium cf. griseofulvum]
MIIPKEF